MAFKKVGQGRFSGGSAVAGLERGSLDDLMKKLLVRREVFIAPAAGASNVHAQIVANIDSGAGLTQPGTPRNLQLVTNAAWDGGSLEVTGYCADGILRTETIVPVVGGGTKVGTYAFALLTHLKNTGTFSAGTADLQLAAAASTSFGVAARGIVDFLKLAVDGANEAIAAESLSLGTFRPTTVPNAAHHYEITYLVDEVGDLPVSDVYDA